MEPGDTLAILGPSGVGKSTLLHILGGLDRPSQGSVRLGDVDVGSLSGPALDSYRSRRVGFVFQDHHLLPQLTALENVLLPGLAPAAPKQDSARAQDLLDRVGLRERGDAFPFQLSGGERQRVALSRALYHQPQLLLCDEPTGNLDSDTGARIGDLLVSLASEKNTMIIVVTHNESLARLFGKQMLLGKGELCRA